MKRNFAINKTNPRLTGNIKVVVDSTGTIFLESINSNDWLSRSMFKGFKFNSNLKYFSNVRNFISQAGTSSAKFFDVLTLPEQTTISTSLYDQYNQLYHAGTYSEESQLIDENFRCFAPIMINDVSNLPEYFVILETDSKSNSIADVLSSKYRVVEGYDMSKVNSNVLSQVGNSNIMTDMDNILVTGLDVTTGLLTTVSDRSMTDMMSNEQTITENNNWLTNSFSRNSLMFTNIVNMEFAFTDRVVTNKLTRYVGFYCSKTVVEDIKNYSGTLRLCFKENEIVHYDEDAVLGKYIGRQLSITGSRFGQKSNAVVDVLMTTNPAPSSILQFALNGTSDFTFVISAEKISKNVDETRRNIADMVNTEYGGNSLVVDAQVIGQVIRFTVQNELEHNEKVTYFSTSPAFSTMKSRFNNQRSNEFVKSDEYSILSTAHYKIEKFTHAMFIDKATSSVKLIEIESIQDYMGQNMYTLAEQVPTGMRSGDMFWLVEMYDEVNAVMSILDTHELETSTDINNHENVCDFDTELYHEFLLNELADSSYVGSAKQYWQTNDITDDQLAEYKSMLTDKLEKYFASTEMNTQPFVHSINDVTLESTLIADPYERLLENDIALLRSRTKFIEFINKWSNGVDSTNNPNILNISLPWKHESMNASHVETSRDVYKNTHDWFVIIDGLPNYELKHKNMYASYSQLPLDADSFTDTTSDAYEFMKHHFDDSTINMYALAEYDGAQKSSFAYFKGVKYRIERNINNYKFAVVMKCSSQIVDDVFKIQAIQNDTFKTFTLFINFYIPEPILTSLERDERYYFVDKSLLYYSTEVYTTIDSSVDFGTDSISLKLYDTYETKKYLGETLPSKDWFATDAQGNTILYVSRGNSAIFNTDMRDIIYAGSNFSIEFTRSEDVDSPWFGMRIDFIDIVEVEKDYFWCKKIIVNSNINTDVEYNDAMWELDDNYVDEVLAFDVYGMYAANPYIFYMNNFVYISRAIAFEVCVYKKVVSTSANDARYKEMCLSNIKQILKSRSVAMSDGSRIRCYVDDMLSGTIVVNVENSSGVVTTLSRPFSYNIYRQNLEYKPLTRPLQSFRKLGTVESAVPLKRCNAVVYNRLISKVSNDYINKLFVSQTTDDYNIDELYEYVKSTYQESLTTEKLPWHAAPCEHRAYFGSYVFNTPEKITAQFDLSENRLSEIFKAYILRMTNINTVTPETLAEFMNISTNVDSTVVDNYSAIDIIASNFVNNVMSKIYRVESIVDSEGTLLQFVTYNDSIFINDAPTGTATITITR